MAPHGLLFAQGKPTDYFSKASAAKKIRNLQAFYGLPKWSFVVYRCTYGDDESWAQFMSRLN